MHLAADAWPTVRTVRLGHRLPGVRGIYSHVTPAVEQRLIDGLQARWDNTARR